MSLLDYTLRCARAAMLLAFLVNPAYANPPEWWYNGTPPLITGDPVANHSLANIGQAKYMAKQALAAIRAQDANVADQIEEDLVGPGRPITSWAPPSTPEESARQYAPLLIGQLKSISAPFYTHLHEFSPDWLDGELVANETKDNADQENYFPWTSNPADDLNKAPSTIGQLKAVFSLRFENMASFSHPKPSIVISSPQNDFIMALGSIIDIKASAEVTSGNVVKVLYYRNGTYVGEDDSFPFSYSFQPLTSETSDISAVAVSDLDVHSDPYHVAITTPYDVDQDGLSDSKEFQAVGSLDDGLSDDSDGDGIPNGFELNSDPPSDPFDLSSNGGDTDGDRLPDGWELYYFGDKTHNGTTSSDGDWLTDLEEYQFRTNPTFNDDVDLDGWLDRDESIIINKDLTDAIVSPSDLLPWADQDGDGLPNAVEVSQGSNPLSPTDPSIPITAPLVKLTANHFISSGAVAVWANDGRAGGTFVSESAKPSLVTKSGKQAVELQANQANWMTSPRVSPWLNGSGSRTVVAWVYNSTVSSLEDDVLFSWGGGALGSTQPSLFSCRYGASATKGALSQSGILSVEDRGWASYQPVPGTWSFVVYRYNSADGTLLAMRDFEAGFLKRNTFLQTGVFDSLSRPYSFVLGGENKGDGTRDTSLKTGLCIGELQVFDRAVPLSEIISDIYNPSRAAYGKSTPLADTDLDELPDLLEVSLGLSPALKDSDQDGVEDGVEFKAGNDAKDFYNGMPHYVTITGGTNQLVWQGWETSSPIRFKVTDVNGNPIPGAPADISVITVPTANGKIRLTPVGSPLSPTLSTRTNAAGEISIFFKAN